MAAGMNELSAGKYKVSLALLCGSGFTSLVTLLLDSPNSRVSWAAFSLLAPGGVALAGFSVSPIAIFPVNILLYSVLALVIVFVCCRKARTASLRVATIALAVGASILLSLACVPALNPLWPRGMTELARKEAELRDVFPVSIGLGQAEASMRTEGIQYWEHTYEATANVLSRADARIDAAAGDLVLSARVPTNAFRFPCGYDIELLLVFGQDQKLKQRYINRMRVCP